MQMFRIAINKLFELRIALLASHRGGSGSIPSRDMLVLVALVEDGDDLGQVSPWFKCYVFIQRRTGPL
jgi:hypothetical protein